jgi:hypothetical protein
VCFIHAASGELSLKDLANSTVIRFDSQMQSIGISEDLVLMWVVSPNLYWSNSSPTGNTWIWDVKANTMTFVAEWSALSVWRMPLVYSKSRNATYGMASAGLFGAASVWKLDLGGCANDCSGHGTCTKNAYCTCEPPFTGNNCNYTCDNTCVHGTCVAENKFSRTGVCGCEPGWVGPACDQPLDCHDGYPARSDYRNNTSPIICSCSGSSGEFCENFCVSGFTCFGDAICNASSQCECVGHFTGEHCEIDLALESMRMLTCRQQYGDFGVDLTGFTWCRYDNPTIAPLRLPPPSDPTSLAFDVSPCPPNSRPTDPCKAVTALSTFGWTASSRVNSFVLSGFADGHFILASFTNESVRSLCVSICQK